MKKINLVVGLTLCCFFNVYSQGKLELELVWEKEIEGYGYIQANSMTFDDAGNLYLAGENPPPEASTAKLWYASLNPEGEIRWQKLLRDDKIHTLGHILWDAKLGLVLTGDYQIGFSELDPLIIRANPDNGEWIWNQRITWGGSYDNIPQTCVDRNGHIHAAGLNSSEGIWQGSYLEINPNGVILTKKTFDVGSYRWFLGIALHPMGGLQLLLPGNNGSSSDGDGFGYLRLDSDGEIFSRKDAGSFMFKDGKDLICLQEKGFVAAGAFTPPEYGAGHAIVQRTDLEGELIWEQTLKGGDGAEAVHLSSNGEGIIGVSGLTRDDDYDVFLWLLDEANGEVLGYNRYGDRSENMAHAIGFAPDGSLYLAMSMESSEGDVCVVKKFRVKEK